MKQLIIIAMLVLMASSVMAAYTMPSFQSMECDGFSGSTDFEEGDDICFYGVGFKEGMVDISLDNKGDGSDYDLSDVDIEHGVLSSIIGDAKVFFDDVKGGIYRLVIKQDEETFVYGSDITVSGEVICDGDFCYEDGYDPKDPGQDPDDVPEFSTFAAIFALIGAGLYINARRRS